MCPTLMQTHVMLRSVEVCEYREIHNNTAFIHTVMIVKESFEENTG
jgi:hypothetical protein